MDAFMTDAEGVNAGRRRLLKTGAALGAVVASGSALAQSFEFKAAQRYPDPAVEILDPSFAKYRLFSSTVEQVATGFRWVEGPVYFADGRYLLFSDIPNNRIIKFDETSNQWSVFRSPANFTNGHCRDKQGRLISCEHLTRRVTRTEYDGSITVLADRYQGKRFNSPNDIVCKSDGSLWFTDPPFGISGEWEGDKAASELPHAVYRIDPSDNSVTQVIGDLNGPNGLAFSPDEKKLYVIESRAQPNRLMWAYDVGADGRLGNKTRLLDANGPGALDGFKVDIDGNIWAGWGSNGAAGADPSKLDGVRIFNSQGKAIGHIHLPERCPNLCFGGPKRNRLYMASSHSVYALYVETRGAV
ncbi:SMP-30/gluconolactonase/LRE family protein [Cupriavidus sp. DL-D2]|uniref:SMP-30/gluconolactonase/LRE family protein n=1 Tax=Cupriavidus sp. DL-D2 TaxID=3144974 RepID=UPI0032153460